MNESNHEHNMSGDARSSITHRGIFEVTIDGQRIDAEKGKTILEVSRQYGIKIPTLCYHPGLQPLGACRLCVVEITKPEWQGIKKIVPSCLSPIEDKLIVETESPQVREHRKVLLNLQLARAPESDVIRSLAEEYGILETSYTKREKADNCIMCGICVRVCETIGIGAISFVSRGTNKYVDVPNKDVCIGCLACARNCPTGAIQFEQVNGKRRIWDREFDLIRCFASGEPIATMQEIEYLAKRNDLPRESFLKSPRIREMETAGSAVIVKV